MQFTADGSRLIAAAVGGATEGVDLYDVPPMAPAFRRTRRTVTSHAVTMVAYCHVSGRAAMVVADTMRGRTVVLCDAHSGAVLTELCFEAAVLQLRINAKRLMVIVAERIHLLALPSMKPLHQIQTVSPPNTSGIGALSPFAHDTCYVAWPHTDEVQSRGGGLALLDCEAGILSLTAAHQTSVDAVEFDSSGSRLATCSVKGTVIRVFSVPHLTHLTTLRRGSSEAQVTRLAFSPRGDMLMAASANGTLHLFDLSEREASLTGTSSFARIPLRVGRCVCALSADCRTAVLVEDPVPGQQAVLEVWKVAGDKVSKVNEYVIR